MFAVVFDPIMGLLVHFYIKVKIERMTLFTTLIPVDYRVMCLHLKYSIYFEKDEWKETKAS